MTFNFFFFFLVSRYLGHDTIHVSPAQVSRCIDASMHRYALSHHLATNVLLFAYPSRYREEEEEGRCRATPCHRHGHHQVWQLPQVPSTRGHRYADKRETTYTCIRNILVMVTTIKMIVILNLLWSEFVETKIDVSICFYRS